ncbi:uncharacterized protein G6M90_00g032570 [Metarhizium brunneum]|uniref:HD domain-containing protein n=1 Tax=Metarhizium brunneum TaxID=500148 RepID=A0A7D5YNI8_9HYPO|nr:hypothetical protein G6M90_00g032570 [Metarhizium brunneum]
MCQSEIAANGWTNMPANAGLIFGNRLACVETVALPMDDLTFPFDDVVVEKTMEYAKKVLHPETFNHSMRVYFYGMAITKQHFPKLASELNPVTWALTCLLHDLGTAEEFLTATRMSFDIYGGIKALQALKDFGATTDQAEAAAEAIIRHEDMGVDGEITYMGQLIQLATTFDNTGFHPHVAGFKTLIHRSTVAEINEAYPRLKWCAFFSDIIRMEETLKPWCHSTHLVNFDKEIETNTLMAEWE